VHIDEALAYSQAQAGAFLSGTDLSVKLRELFKHSGDIVLRNAATCVFDKDEDVIVTVFTADVYGAALRRELEAVRQKIHDNFFYSVGIGVQNNRMGGKLTGQIDLLCFRLLTVFIDGFRYEMTDVGVSSEKLYFAGFYFGDVQQIVNDSRESIEVFHRHIEYFFLPGDDFTRYLVDEQFDGPGNN
jgi:hypothetical protein